MGEAENRFPTVSDMRAVLDELVAAGFGDLPVQILVVPDSSMQAFARHAGATEDSKPALMIQFEGRGGRLPASIITADRLSDDTPRVAVQ